MFKKLIIATINFYQKTISPDHGLFSVFFPQGFCRYTPSCSEYTKQSIVKYGFLKGIFLASKRIVRCNPWAGMGADPVPEQKY